jgi:Na+/citrate or Na+/malate symporter
MPTWLRNRVAWFFLGMAALMIVVNAVIIGLGIPILPYIFAGLAVLYILVALWMTTARIISDEEFEQRRERR